MHARVVAALAFWCAASAASAATATTPRIVAAADAFLATLDPAQKTTVQFAQGDTAQKQRWSNLPGGAFQRAGLRWADMSEAQRNAWLAVMQATLSDAGYDRVLAEWRADDALAAGGAGGGRSPQFGMGFYYIAL